MVGASFHRRVGDFNGKAYFVRIPQKLLFLRLLFSKRRLRLKLEAMNFGLTMVRAFGVGDL
jgi:hypothetical protein